MSIVRKTKAFTLIEVLIVVVIMAVLAATVIPQFASSTADAKQSAVKFNTHTLRSQIELYKIHHGAYPDDLTGDSLPQLLIKTDAAGDPSDDGPFGPYLDGDIPANPFDNSNKVTSTDEEAPTTHTGTLGGWQYNPTTGGIWPNHDGWTPD